MPFAFTVDDVKESAEKRQEFGVKVKDQAPKSPIYKQNTEVQAAADSVMAETDLLTTAIADTIKAEAALKKARTALSTAIVRWDATFDVYLATGGKACSSADEGAGLGFKAQKRTRRPLVPPLSIKLRHDTERNLLRIAVKRAPGRWSTLIQVSHDGGVTWTQLDGHGALQAIASPAPGPWLVRAASATATERSEFTAPAAITVK
jgi:hypothetical protein